MSRTATPTPHDADVWSAASALMSLHNGNDRHTPTNGVIARPTTGDAAPEGARRPALPTPRSDTPAATTQTNSTAPVVNVIAGDIDLLPPRFGMDCSLDADNWLNFLAYVRLQKISLEDAVVVFRTRMTGTAHLWIETVPEGLSLEEHITSFKERFSVSSDSCRSAEFWERRQLTDEKTANYIEDKACLA